MEKLTDRLHQTSSYRSDLTIPDEMLQSENSGLAGRVQDLERKVLTQQDEIVCLRSTLADVLRRLNLIEGNIDRGSANLHGGRSAPNTPSRTSTPSFNRGNET